MSSQNESKENEVGDGCGIRDDMQLIPGKSLINRDLYDSSYDRDKLSPLVIESDEKRKFDIGGLTIIIISTVVFSFCVTLALIVTIYHEYGMKLKHVSVASSVHECSKIGVNLMERGGSATDAAIGTALCLCVMNPISVGLGSGGFMMFRDNKRNISEVFDFMSSAPNGSTSDMLSKIADDLSHRGLSVAVPGMLHGFSEAHSRYGKIPWKEVVIPAADIALNGFNVSDTLSAVIAYEMENAGNKNYNSLLNHFTLPNGKVVSSGDLFIQPNLGKLLYVIAENGIDEFYYGAYSSEIVDFLKNYNGIMKKSDLAGYRCLIKEPIEVKFKQSIIQTAPSPASGLFILSAMSFLNRYNFSHETVGSNESYLHLLNALKFSSDAVFDYHHDALLDTDETNISQTYYLSDNYFKKILSPSQNETNNQSNQAKIMSSKSLMTSQISVYDYDDVMVSMSLSLGGVFGSKIITPSGILLNNFMTFFQNDATANQSFSHYNVIKANERPIVSMAPTQVFSRKYPCSHRISLGVSGDSKGLFSIVEVILNAVGMKQPLEKSIKSTNFFHHDDNSTTYTGDMVQFLQNNRHLFKHSKYSTNINAAAKINETVEAYSDFMDDNEVFVQ